MKKLILTGILVVVTGFAYSQSHNVTSAAIIFKQYKSEKDKSIKAHKIKEAKDFIDLAFNNESTSNAPKMWNYRAPIYLEIALKQPNLDKDAILKATEAHIKCLQKDKRGRSIVRKWTNKEDVLTGIVQCAYKLFNQATEEYNAGEYENSLKHYNAIFEIMPFDEEDQLKRGNITSETVRYRSFLANKRMNKNSQSKKILQELIDMSFNEPNIYIEISNIYLEEKNIDKALEYIELGREMFEDEQTIITAEINLYIQLNRTEELINKLTLAVDSDSENELYYVMRGTCYQNLDKTEEAISDYRLALEINPDQLTALNNISSCYLKQTEPLIIKLNNLSYNQTSLYNKYKNNIQELHTLVLPYLEKLVNLKPDDIPILTALSEIYYKLEMYEKSQAIKQRIKK